MSEKPSFYLPQLDGLRFGAALLVFFHHAPKISGLEPLKNFGWIGVDLFLSISAFLLTRLLYLEWQSNGEIRLRAFYIRRALRIWPLFLCYATAMCIWTAVNGGLDYETILAWWLSFITFSNNLLTALIGYSPVGFTSHLWTIALEEQAYVLLPLILIVFLDTRAPLKVLLKGAVVVICMLILARTAFVLVEAEHPFIWVLPLRADPFILGAVAAIILDDKAIPKPWTILCLGLVLMASVSFFPSFNKPGAYQVIGYTISAIGCTAVVIAVQAPGIVASLLSWSTFRYLGKISYGIYVYHILCIALAANLVFQTGLSGTEQGRVLVLGIGFILTVCVSAVSYELLEKPFLKMKARYTRVVSRAV